MVFPFSNENTELGQWWDSPMFTPPAATQSSEAWVPKALSLYPTVSCPGYCVQHSSKCGAYTAQLTSPGTGQDVQILRSHRRPTYWKYLVTRVDTLWALQVLHVGQMPIKCEDIDFGSSLLTSWLQAFLQSLVPPSSSFVNIIIITHLSAHNPGVGFMHCFMKVKLMPVQHFY